MQLPHFDSSALNLRTFASNFVTGVAVVTSCAGKSATYHGLTMNAVTSLSLKPPLYLVCLDRFSKTLEAILESKRFAINFLAAHQNALSKRFASKDPDKFEDVNFKVGRLDCPLLDGVVAACECRLKSVYPGGDHKIIIGAVKHIHIYGGNPLVFHNGKFIHYGISPPSEPTTTHQLNLSRTNAAHMMR